MNTATLENKTIVITGASSGAGRAAAIEFAKYGTNIVLAGRNEQVLYKVAEECKETGAKALVVVTDVTSSAAMLRLAKAAYTWQGRIDVWVNNAGVLAAGAFEETPIKVHTQVITTNLLGYIKGAHAVLPYFKKQKSGILINNISIGGFLPVPYGAAYTASKFGLRGFSEALKGELALWPNIHVCDLFPAFLNTPGIQHAANYTGKVLKPAPPVYDPQLVAKAILHAAASPKSNTYVGSASLLFKAAHAVFPALTTKITGFVMRKYFKVADPIENTSGNVFNTVDFGMDTNGSMPIIKKSSRNKLAVGLVSALAIGFFIVGKFRK